MPKLTSDYKTGLESQVLGLEWPLKKRESFEESNPGSFVPIGEELDFVIEVEVVYAEVRLLGGTPISASGELIDMRMGRANRHKYFFWFRWV